MNLRTALLSALLAVPAAVFAASAPDFLVVNRSSEALMDDATAKALFDEIVSEKLGKLYPPNQWGFASQVEGGLTAANTCVVAARVMLLPRNQPNATKLLLFKPGKMATAFDALPNATSAQCKDLAKKKLREAYQGMSAALVPG